MLQALAPLILWIMKTGVKMAFWITSAFAFVVLINMFISAIAVGFNYGALADVFAMVQMWLPFNLNVVLLWLITAATLYLLWRLTWVALHYINILIKE